MFLEKNVKATIDLCRGLGVALVNGVPGSTCLHKEEARQGPKFIRKKENGHSISASADRQWGSDGDRQRTKELTPANLTLLLSPLYVCATVPSYRIDGKGEAESDPEE